MTTPTPTTRASERAEKPEDPDAEYLTVAQFAWVLNCSPKTVRRYVKDGLPHTRRPGQRRILFSRKDRDYYRESSQAGQRTRTSRQRAA